MLLAEFYKTNKQTNTLPSSNYNWNLDSTKYTAKQIGEMPSWIVQMKENFEQPLTQSKEIDTNSFSEMQSVRNSNCVFENYESRFYWSCI